MGSSTALLRASDLQPRPWPNGLGVTRDLASGPGWLVSIADLAGEAAFSHFAGMDRVFTLIEGPGATLVVGDAALPCLPFVPAHFPGDVPTHYRPGGGPARAFNVFTERGRFEARVVLRSIAASHGFRPGEGCVALHCLAGTLGVGEEELAAGDTLLHPGAAPCLALGGAALAVTVELLPVAAGA